MNELLSSIYYDATNPAAFSSVRNLFKEAKRQNTNITLPNVKEWLKEQITYTLHKPAQRNFVRNRIIVSRIDEQWEADLVDMREFSKENSGYNYILTVIDCFSKYAFAIPIKTKTGILIKKALLKLFSSRTPEYLRTDRGKEFLNSEVQNLLEENKINYFSSKDEKVKCAIVERFNRTLKLRMFKYFTSKGTRRYLDVIKALINGYNNSYHRTIKMRPVDVTRNNTKVVFKNIYKVDNLEELKNPKPTIISVGDKVRIQYNYKPFDKGYYPNWTDEIFTVDKLEKGDKKVVFRIKDYNGNKVEQRFYPEEIQRIKENLHRVEKIIKRRTRKRIKEVFVKWLNYPESYNQWIPESDLQNIYQ